VGDKIGLNDVILFSCLRIRMHQVCLVMSRSLK